MIFQNMYQMKEFPQTSFRPMKYGFYRKTLFWQFVTFFNSNLCIYIVERWFLIEKSFLIRKCLLSY